MKKKKILKKWWITIGVITVLFIIGLFFFWKNPREKEYMSRDGKRIEYTDELYCQVVQWNQVAQIPDKTISYISNELIVTSEQEVSFEDAEMCFKKYDANIVGYIEAADTYQIQLSEIPSYEKLLEVQKTLENEEIISEVCLNKINSFEENAGYYPNDSVFKNEWSEIPSGKNWGLEFIKAPEAWKYLGEMEDKKPQEVEIGVFEVESFDYDHKDLANSFQEKPLGNKENTESEQEIKKDPTKDIQAHGTAVAGIIGAGFDNKIGLPGIVPNVTLRGVSWSGLSGYIEENKKNEIQVSDMEYKMGLAYLIACKSKEQKTAVVNVSMALEDVAFAASRGSEDAQSYLDLLNTELGNYLGRLLDNGYDFLVCKGAGNNNGTTEKRYEYIRADEGDENATYGYIRDDGEEENEEALEKYKNKDDYESRIVCGNVDAQYDMFSGIQNPEIKNRVIVVGSVGMIKDNFVIASEYSCSGSRVDILAPGEQICVLKRGNKYSSKKEWTTNYGTSYSAPFVSGVAGLVLSVNPEFTGEELKEILLNSAEGKYISYLEDKSFTYKALNAEKAVQYADSNSQSSVYSWVVEPTIEADDIYYLADYPDMEHSINELSKQADNSNAVIQKGDELGIIDLDGNLLTDIAYKEISNFGENYMMVKTIPEYSEEFNQEWDIYWLDKKGDTHENVGNGELDLTVYYYYNGIRQRTGNLSSDFVQETIPVQESSVYHALDAQSVMDNLSGKYALEYNCNLITDFIYDECGSLSDGLFAVCQNGKWGYVDETGEVVIPIEYDASWKHYPVFDMSSSRSSSNVKDYCYAASDGYVVLCQGEEWEIKDIAGNDIIQRGTFEAIRPIFDGKCWVKKDGKWGVVQL